MSGFGQLATQLTPADVFGVLPAPSIANIASPTILQIGSGYAGSVTPGSGYAIATATPSNDLAIPEIIDPTTGEPYLTLQDVQNAINSGFQSVTSALPFNLTTWLQQNSTVVYIGAAALFVLALFGGGRRR
jgi:hypothetical protein